MDNYDYKSHNGGRSRWPELSRKAAGRGYTPGSEVPGVAKRERTFMHAPSLASKILQAHARTRFTSARLHLKGQLLAGGRYLVQLVNQIFGGWRAGLAAFDDVLGADGFAIQSFVCI